MGGFLKDGQNGATYAVTCGHVLARGVMASTPTGHLGACIHAMPPTPLPPGTRCSTTCAAMTEIDVALIDVQGAAVTNVATRVAEIVDPGDIVTMKGATSGDMRYEIGGAVVEHSIGGCCWNRLFQFHAPVSGGLLPAAVNVALTPPPKGGDSGAWLLRQQSEWAGMVVASNGLHGYALAGTLILARCNAAFQTQLRLA